MTPLRRRPAKVLSRMEAAQMIRVARNAPRGSDERGELIGWARTVLRDNPLVRRLKIDHLLDVGEYDSADALIARALMRGDSHEAGALMRWRFARSLHAQGRCDEAWRQITMAIEQKPIHCGVLRLAAQIALVRGDTALAVNCLERACEIRSSATGIRSELVEALLACGDLTRAASHMNLLANPLALLHAKMLRAEGRTLEAVELLESARAAESAFSEKSHVELLGALDDLGDTARLNRAINSVTSDHSQAVIVSAKLLLNQGRFHDALAAIEPLLSTALSRRIALPTAIAALTQLDRHDEARSLLIEWRSLEPNADRQVIAQIWLAGLFGRTMAKAIDSRAAGRDPAMDLLGPMLEQSGCVLHEASKCAEGADAVSLAESRDHCLRAMGRKPLGPPENRLPAGRIPAHSNANRIGSRRRAA